MAPKNVSLRAKWRCRRTTSPSKQQYKYKYKKNKNKKNKNKKMADTELPKPELIEVDKTQFCASLTRPNKTITPVQDRLQNSPKKALTPEVLKERQDKAQKRRQLFEEVKVSKAHAVVEHAKEVRERAKQQPKEAQTDA